MDDLRHDTHCRICNSDRIVTVMRLADTPLEDQFVSREHLSYPQPLYPLELALCQDCGYLHLPHIVNPRISYENYAYESSVTVGLRNHYDEYATEIVRGFAVAADSFVVDLGSNDGSMLASFKKLGMRVLGVEPAKRQAEAATQAGLPTINGFFTDDVVAEILQRHGPARVVTANYMYANIDDVLGFTRNVTKLLAPDGIFVVQTGYHPEQMKIRMFDYIYHEHFSYFTAKVLGTIFERCGLELIDLQKRAPKGGSLRAVSQRSNGPRESNPSVTGMIEEEARLGFAKEQIYRDFAIEISAAKDKLKLQLDSLKAQNLKIVGFGASHSTTTLIYHFELAPFLDYLIDDNAIKHGLFSPGHHLPVFPSEKLYGDKPDYVLILAWQHQDNIVQKHREYSKLGGRFLIPLPALRIVGN